MRGSEPDAERIFILRHGAAFSPRLRRGKAYRHPFFRLLSLRFVSFVNYNPIGPQTFQVQRQPQLQGSCPCLNQFGCLRRRQQPHLPVHQRHSERHFELEFASSGLHMPPKAIRHQACKKLLLSSSCQLPRICSHVMTYCFHTSRTCRTSLQPAEGPGAKNRLIGMFRRLRNAVLKFWGRLQLLSTLVTYMIGNLRVRIPSLSTFCIDKSPKCDQRRLRAAGTFGVFYLP